MAVERDPDQLPSPSNEDMKVIKINLQEAMRSERKRKEEEMTPSSIENTATA